MDSHGRVATRGADVFSAYDAAGRRLSARFASASGQGVIYAYDSAGRLASETNTIGTSRALSFQYDAASNRTRVTWPDAFFAQYEYDALNRVDRIAENGVFAGAQLLADHTYDTRGRRDLLTRGNGASTDYSYDAASRLTSLIHDLAGTADDQSFGFAYTAASQLSQRTAANDNYNWTGANISRAYSRNGLNQYTTISGTTQTHDTRGNLTNDGARALAYDLENRLTSVSGSVSATLNYDPLGRLRSYATGGATTDFLYDGDRLVAEYNGATLARRYVHGPGVDEPLVQYTGAGTTNRAYLIADHQGSIIAENGTTTTRYSYGPYGEPNTWAGSRFRYTGQIALPEIQLYHYKARAYDPVLGRFLQTDPLGYEADLNLYAYVRNDPVGATDPLGLDPSCAQPPCRDIPLPNEEVRREGVEPLGQQRGNTETGSNTYQDPQTGETTVVSGDAAGRPVRSDGTEGFAHDRRDTAHGGHRPVGWRTILFTHSHGRADPRSVRGAARSEITRSNNAPSDADQAAMGSSGVAIQINGPQVTGTLYRVGNQDRYHVDRGNVEDVPNVSGQGIIVDGPDE